MKSNIIIVKKNSFYDSVVLMTVSKAVKSMEGVNEAVVVMATDYNKELLKNVDLSNEEVESCTPSDLVIALRAETAAQLEAARTKVDELLNRRNTGGQDYEPPTLDLALSYMPDANMVLISVPGMYAAAEAEKALNAGRHVMVFSDNVSLEDEIRLKKIAQEKGLLMMGPDCGTAIINGVPLAFANKVPRGKIGIVGASGTGSQEISSIIGRLGGGISQLIGTGGRDLKAEVGGIMMAMGLEALLADEATDVVVLVSKPPAGEVMDKILKLAQDSRKKVLVHFIGADLELARGKGFETASTLEETAYKAYEIAYGPAPQDTEEKELSLKAREEAAKLMPRQKYIRGLYSGGSLCDEAMVLMKRVLGKVYSATPILPEEKLPSKDISKEHTIIDMGDDEFTRGRPHPMIDFTARQERLLKEARDPETAVVLMDVVLGYGANIDPAGELAPYIVKAKEIAAKRGDYLPVVISLCGTFDDPQDYDAQKEKLENSGAIVASTNARAVKTCLEIIIKGR